MLCYANLVSAWVFWGYYHCDEWNILGLRMDMLNVLCCRTHSAIVMLC